CHYNVILPQIISRPDKIKTSMEQFTSHVHPGGDCTNYIVQSFCAIVSCLLPWFAVQSRKEGNESEEKIDSRQTKERENPSIRSQPELRVSKTVADATSKFINFAVISVMDKTMATKFDELVLHLLFTMYEPSDEGSDLAAFSSATDPDPNLPYFTSQAIQASLDYLTGCFKGESLVGVLCKSKVSSIKQTPYKDITLLMFCHSAVFNITRAQKCNANFVSGVLASVNQTSERRLRESRPIPSVGAPSLKTLKDNIQKILLALNQRIFENSLDIREETSIVHVQALCFACLERARWGTGQHMGFRHQRRHLFSKELNTHLHVIVSTLVPYAKASDDKAQQ
ncbi:hypothetical protein QZH41_016010, partial [Actinostola sp. cb2023]